MGIKVTDKRNKGQSISESRAKARPKGYRKTQKAKDEAGQLGGVFGSKNKAVREKATRDLWKKTGVKNMPGSSGKKKTALRGAKKKTPMKKKRK